VQQAEVVGRAARREVGADLTSAQL